MQKMDKRCGGKVIGMLNCVAVRKQDVAIRQIAYKAYMNRDNSQGSGSGARPLSLLPQRHVSNQKAEFARLLEAGPIVIYRTSLVYRPYRTRPSSLKRTWLFGKNINVCLLFVFTALAETKNLHFFLNSTSFEQLFFFRNSKIKL